MGLRPDWTSTEAMAHYPEEKTRKLTSPEDAGPPVVHRATDPDRHRWRGKAAEIGELARGYRLHDVDGRWIDSPAEVARRPVPGIPPDRRVRTRARPQSLGGISEWRTSRRDLPVTGTPSRRQRWGRASLLEHRECSRTCLPGHRVPGGPVSELDPAPWERRTRPAKLDEHSPPPKSERRPSRQRGGSRGPGGVSMSALERDPRASVSPEHAGIVSHLRAPRAQLRAEKRVAVLEELSLPFSQVLPEGGSGDPLSPCDRRPARTCWDLQQAGIAGHHQRADLRIGQPLEQVDRRGRYGPDRVQSRTVGDRQDLNRAQAP